MPQSNCSLIGRRHTGHLAPGLIVDSNEVESVKIITLVGLTSLANLYLNRDQLFLPRENRCDYFKLDIRLQAFLSSLDNTAALAHLFLLQKTAPSTIIHQGNSLARWDKGAKVIPSFSFTSTPKSCNTFWHSSRICLYVPTTRCY